MSRRSAASLAESFHGLYKQGYDEGYKQGIRDCERLLKWADLDMDKVMETIQDGWGKKSQDG
jgi:hypothetical protein